MAHSSAKFDGTAAAAELCIIPLLVIGTILVAINCIRPQSETSPRRLPQTSRLLTLPPELRHLIWLHVIPGELELSKDHPQPHPPGLALACRQTLIEVLPIFLYESNFNINIHADDMLFIEESMHELGRLCHLLNRISGLPVRYVPMKHVNLVHSGLENEENFHAASGLFVDEAMRVWMQEAKESAGGRGGAEGRSLRNGVGQSRP